MFVFLFIYLFIYLFFFSICSAEGGELTQNLAKNSSGSYTEANVHVYAKQLVSALAHIHEKNVIHGDLAVSKPVIQYFFTILTFKILY